MPSPKPQKGRGAISNIAGRFEKRDREDFDDGWDSLADVAPGRETQLIAEQARSIVSTNQSPDVPFEQSINPYKGCEHGCIYCFARPTHAYLDLSPGLDFETRIYYKANAVERLTATLRKPGYRCSPIALGANTDPYQPAEKRLGVTRGILETLSECDHPVSIITKGTVVERDIELLADMATRNLASVFVSVTSLDNTIKRTLEPRAAGPARRLELVKRLTEAGVPTGVLVAPVIPAVTDHEMEAILERAAEAGAGWAGYILLRLPHEVAPLFREWLEAHYPQRTEHVMSLLRQSRGGKDYDARFGERMRGTGAFADLLAQRFRVACTRNRLNERRRLVLDTERFRPPPSDSPQMALL